MKKNLFLIIFISTFALSSLSASAQCAVDGGVAPELAQYLRDTAATANAINTRSPNICGTFQSPVSSANRVSSTLEKAKSGVPIMNNIVSDFLFHVTTVFRLEASQKVIDQGNLLYNLEKNTLIPVLDQLAAKCQLSGQAETDMIALIQRNNDLQSFFQQVVMGNVGSAPDGDVLKAGILRTYRPENNLTCSDSQDISTTMEKLLKKTEKFGTDISKARENWNEALRLIHGTSGAGLQKYQELETALLRRELSKQGLSQNAITQMMNNLSCAQAEGNETLNTEDQAIAESQCTRNYVVGYEKLKTTLESLKWQAKTSDEYIQIEQQSQKTITRQVDTYTLYSNLSNMALGENNSEAITNKIITDLTNIHTNLVSINTLLEKRIPKMQQNCKKGLPEIIGGCAVE